MLAVAAGAHCTRSLYGYVYRSADTLLFTRIDGYLDLRGDQATLTKERLRSLHRWHRQSELPAYSADLKRLAEKSQDGLDASEVRWLFGRLKHFERRIYATTRSSTVEILSSLSPEQISHLERRLEKSNEELAAEVALSAQERRKRRVAKTIKNVEEWVGELSPEQKEQLTQLIGKLPDTSAVRLRYRRERQREFIALLRNKPTRDELRAWLETRFGYDPRALPEYYRGPVARSGRAFQRFVLDLDRMLTADQRRTARERLVALASDLRQWSK